MPSYFNHKKVFLTEKNFNIVEQVTKLEDQDKLEEAQDIFSNAVRTCGSALVWVDCANSYMRSSDFRHAGIAFMLAAGVSDSKRKPAFVKQNFDSAALAFEKSGDKARAVSCHKKREDLCAHLLFVPKPRSCHKPLAENNDDLRFRSM